MKRESMVIGIAGLVLGFALGIIAPKLFGKKEMIAKAPPTQEQPAVPQGPTPEQLEHVIKEYQKIIKDDPNNSNVWLELGSTYYAALKFKDATDAYHKVLELDPKNVDAYIQLGNVHYDMKKPKESIEYYQKALELRPKMSDVQVDMATMYRFNNQPDRAIEEYRKVINYEPTHAHAYINLGITLKFDKKDLPGAIQAWKSLLKVIPTGPKAEEAKARIAEAEKELAAQQQKGN